MRNNFELFPVLKKILVLQKRIRVNIKLKNLISFCKNPNGCPKLPKKIFGNFITPPKIFFIYYKKYTYFFLICGVVDLKRHFLIVAFLFTKEPVNSTFIHLFVGVLSTFIFAHFLLKYFIHKGTCEFYILKV